MDQRVRRPIILQPRLVSVPQPWHDYGVNTIVRLDRSNRIVLSLDLRKAAGIPRGQKLNVSASPGRITLEVAPNPSGKIVRKGKLKVWTGKVPHLPLADAVESVRRYER
jgi:hypothetical protein